MVAASLFTWHLHCEKDYRRMAEVIGLIDLMMSVLAIFHQRGSGVLVTPFAKSELLY